MVVHGTEIIIAGGIRGLDIEDSKNMSPEEREELSLLYVLRTEKIRYPGFGSQATMDGVDTSDFHSPSEELSPFSHVGRFDDSRKVKVHLIESPEIRTAALETIIEVKDGDRMSQVLKRVCERWGIMKDRYVIKLHDQTNAIPLNVKIKALDSVTDLDVVHRDYNPKKV